MRPSVASPKNIEEAQKSTKEAFDHHAFLCLQVIHHSIIVVLRVLDRTDSPHIRRGIIRSDVPFVTKKGPITVVSVTHQCRVFSRELHQEGKISFIALFE